MSIFQHQQILISSLSEGQTDDITNMCCTKSHIGNIMFKYPFKTDKKSIIKVVVLFNSLSALLQKRVQREGQGFNFSEASDEILVLS